jgi:signal transduction histidine kinase
LYATYAVVLDVVLAAVYATVAAVIFWRKPDDRMALFVSFTLLTFGTANFPDTINALVTEHSAWWWPAAVLNFLGAASFGFFLYLFPDGRFVPRWTRWVAFTWVAWQLPKYWFPSWASSDLNSWPSWFAAVVWLVALGTVLYAQVYRYRRVSTALRRQQIKWVVFGISAAVLTFLGVNVALSAFAPAPTSPDTLATILVGYVLIYAAMLLIPISIGVAILRQQLWDIDLIINRALVYGALTASVVLLYVLVVGGLGEIIQIRGNLLVSLFTTGLAAVLFQPLRYRLQRFVNHLMYGDRDDPYAVLSRLGSRLESTLAPDAVLPAVAKTVKEALKLPYAEIQLKRKGVFDTATTAGDPVDDVIRLPLVYGGETVGRLLLGPRAGQTGFSDAERRLLEDLAHQIAAPAHDALMTDETLRLSADLQRSRVRLVKAREEERRRLRRDLHDGLGPQLASLTMTAEAARDLISTNPRRAEEMLGDLMERTQGAVSDVRRLVYALRPPALDALGLLGALRAHADHHNNGDVQVLIDAPKDLPPLPAAVEVAAYRISLEAVNNAERHAGADSCTVRIMLDEAAGTLSVEITDDGQGIGDNRGTGIGLSSMRERAAELGGWCKVGIVASGGTSVCACLPCAPEAGTDKDSIESNSEEV